MTRESATITMSAAVLDQIRTVAKTQKRTLSQQIELLVEAHFAAKKPAKGGNMRKGAAV